MCLVATGWTTTRNRRQAATSASAASSLPAQPVPGPSAPVQPTPAPVQPTPPIPPVIDLTEEIPTANASANSSIEHKLACTLSLSYIYLVKMHNDEQQLNNLGHLGWGLNITSFEHRKIMTMIDRHFRDYSMDRELDPEIIAYVAAKVDTSHMSSLDRIRMELVKLEAERNHHQVRNRRQKRLRGNMERHIACPVCMVDFTPQIDAVYPPCGHVACLKCCITILERPDLLSACSSCRGVIRNRDELEPIYFRFNSQNDVICRYCEVPFKIDASDDDMCHVLTCGHAFHKKCMLRVKTNCCACNAFIAGAGKVVFNHFG